MATRHMIKRGKVHYARYEDRNGRLRWKSLQTNSKEVARQKFAQLEEMLQKEEIGWLNPKSIAEYLPEYLAICEAEHSKTTFRNEKKILGSFLAYCGSQNLSQITADIIEKYKVGRVHEVSKSTVNRSLTVIKAFFNRALALGYLNRNPAQFIKKFKEDQRQIEILSDDDVRKLIEACSPWVRKIVTVFLFTGMRLGELAHLRWKDVDFRHNLIHIQNQKDWATKSRKPRVIPMLPVVKEIFGSLANAGGECYIFPTSSGKTIDGYIRAEVLRYAEKAGVRANIKMFRSTFASNLVMKGADIYSVSKLLGHHDVKITERHYAHLTPEFLINSITKLDSPTSKDSLLCGISDQKQTY